MVIGAASFIIMSHYLTLGVLAAQTGRAQSEESAVTGRGPGSPDIKDVMLQQAEALVHPDKIPTQAKEAWVGSRHFRNYAFEKPYFLHQPLSHSVKSVVAEPMSAAPSGM